MRTAVEAKTDALQEALESDNESAIRAKLVNLEQALVDLGVRFHVLESLRDATLRTQRRPRKKQRVVDPWQEHPGDIDEKYAGYAEDAD